MSDTARAILLGFFTLASAIWIGGYVAIAVVARIATRTLDATAKVAFFRALGRSYLWVGTGSLAVALGTGAGLLADHGWDGTLIATIVVAALLVLTLGTGVVQARRMTRLRVAALRAAEDGGREELRQRVARGARGAALLRGVIGLLTLALIALGALLAT